MPTQILSRIIVCVLPVVSTALLMLYGCGPTADSLPFNLGATSDELTAADEPQDKPTGILVSPDGDPASTFVDARPAALVDSRPVNWGELRPTLNELAGAEALSEIILNRKISHALEVADRVITADDVAAERKQLLENLSDDPNKAIRLLDELRDRQQLGRVRFENLLRRNAGLRALIRDKVSVSDQAVRSMHDIVHGPRRQARIIVVDELNTAQAAINLVNSGMSFSDVAVEMSTDSSAPRGGLLEPISAADPSYPQSLRQTMETLNPGEISGPVLVDDQYAVIMMVKRVAADGVSLEDARPSLQKLVRLNQERLLMDELANRMIAESTVTILDDSLNESWKRRKGPGIRD